MYCEGVRTRAQSQSEMMKYEINSYSNNDIVFFLYVQYLIFSNICDSIKIYTYSTCTLFFHVYLKSQVYSLINQIHLLEVGKNLLVFQSFFN